MSAQVFPIIARQPSQPSQVHLRKEADHRIANNLAMIGSLVRLQALEADVSDPRMFLIEIAERIETVAKLHRHLAGSSSEEVRLGEYLQEICDRLADSVATTEPRIRFTCSTSHAVPSSVALPLGLITAELVSNSLKYAHPAGLPVKISLSCHQNEMGGIAMVYEDDGVGFPEGFDISNNGHIGMKVINALTRQVNATSEWSSDALGIRFEMLVPAPEYGS